MAPINFQLRSTNNYYAAEPLNIDITFVISLSVSDLAMQLLFYRKAVELEEELQVVTNNMKSLEIFEQEARPSPTASS